MCPKSVLPLIYDLLVPLRKIQSHRYRQVVFSKFFFFFAPPKRVRLLLVSTPVRVTIGIAFVELSGVVFGAFHLLFGKLFNGVVIEDVFGFVHIVYKFMRNIDDCFERVFAPKFLQTIGLYASFY